MKKPALGRHGRWDVEDGEGGADPAIVVGSYYV
jgi:hypothetical protein